MIKRNKFNKILKETILDFEAVNDFTFANKLKIILKTKNLKDLTIMQISPLVELVSTTDPNILPEIKREHEIMKEYLSYFFNFNNIPGTNLIVTSKKGSKNEKI